MGTYHTFFVATDDDLDRLFPGWKPVKPQKVSKEGINPFTKQKIMLEVWEPVEPPMPLGKPSLYDDVWGSPLPPVITADDAYMDGIEQAGAPGLCALPHFRGKNYDPFFLLEPLAAALAGEDVNAPPARVGCKGDDDGSEKASRDR